MTNERYEALRDAAKAVCGYCDSEFDLELAPGIGLAHRVPAGRSAVVWQACSAVGIHRLLDHWPAAEGTIARVIPCFPPYFRKSAHAEQEGIA